MKIKLLTLPLLVIIFTLIFVPTSFATDATISSGGTYDLATYGNSSNITISTTDAVTLTQSNATTPLTDFQIICSVSDANITITSININNSSNTNNCALSFTGSNNTLTIEGASTLISGENKAGINVGAGTTLTITETTTTGELNVTGGIDGAGIGGNSSENGGAITINDGTIYATGGNYGAGIGGGDDGNSGTIKILGGTITSSGYSGGAGIGGGSEGTATGITISGGRVTATGNAGGGTGIGGGSRRSGGIITISGGEVFAYGASTRDIGQGYNYTGFASTNIYISGSSTVFIKTNFTNTIHTSTHSKYTSETISGGIAYGYTVPTGWTGTAYAWLLSHTVTYTAGANGSLGSGAISESVFNNQHPTSAPTTIPDAGYKFIGWSDGITTSTNLSDFTITADTTLTAQFVVISVTGVSLNKTALNFNKDVSDTLVCTVSPSDAQDKSVTWVSDNENVATVSVVDDVTCMVTAKDYGTATITVTTTDGSFTDICIVTVEDPSDYTSTKHGGITGKLIDANGDGLEGYKITLYSTPKTVTTSSSGSFRYSNAAYSNHTLVIETPAGVEIERYSLTFNEGSTSGFSHSGNDIVLTYTNASANVNLIFQANSSLDGVTFAGATFVDNPSTNDTTTWLQSVLNLFSNLFI